VPVDKPVEKQCITLEAEVKELKAKVAGIHTADRVFDEYNKGQQLS
jgi:hypothetical protein